MIPLLNRGGMMKGFVEGADRQQTTLLPECLDDWVDGSNPVRAVDVFVDTLELRELGFDGVTPAATGRPGYHPSPMLKLYIYGCPSSDDLRLVRRFVKGGSGSSGLEFKRPATDAASVG